MRDDRTEALVDLAVLAVGAAAAVYILKTPPLRRLVWRLARFGLFTAAPQLLWQEVSRAWEDSRSEVRNLE